MTTEDKRIVIAIIRREQDSILMVESKLKEKKEKIEKMEDNNKNSK